MSVFPVVRFDANPINFIRAAKSIHIAQEFRFQQNTTALISLYIYDLLYFWCEPSH